MPVVNRIADYAPQMTEWRRYLHTIPELGNDCFKTAAFVAERLRDFGVDELHEGFATTGIVAIINGQAEGPTIGLRADMDALPIPEETGLDYASTHAGKMHACGHDGHTTMLLGAAKYLAETRNFAGRVALIFQPAEETGGGAEVMVEEGILDRFDIGQVYALHNAPGFEKGGFYTSPGAMMAAVERGVGGQAMFLQGAAGDINPFWDKTSLADGAYEQMRSMGETIGAAVVRVRRELFFADVESIALGVERVQISPRWDIDDPAIRAGVRRDYVERFGREGEAEVKTLLIGSDLALVSFPGEFFVEHGLRLKDESVVINTLFVGYSNGHLGYFPTIKAAAQGGYGAGSSTIVEVGAGELLVNRALINLAYLSGQVSRTP